MLLGRDKEMPVFCDCMPDTALPCSTGALWFAGLQEMTAEFHRLTITYEEVWLPL